MEQLGAEVRLEYCRNGGGTAANRWPDDLLRRQPPVLWHLNAAPTHPQFTSRCNNRDGKALKVSLQNLLDSPLIAFMWGFSRC
jgi:hypothetical protein